MCLINPLVYDEDEEAEYIVEREDREEGGVKYGDLKQS